MTTTEDYALNEVFLDHLKKKLEAMKLPDGKLRPEAFDALARMEAGTYGQCTRCEKPIPVERIEAFPQTEHCLDCAKDIAREKDAPADGGGSEVAGEKQFVDGVMPAALSLGARMVPVEELHPTPDNIREFEIEVDDKLKGLAATITAVGLMQRLNVRPRPEGGYEIVDGYRRFAALTKVLGWREIPVEIEDRTDKERREAMLVSVLHREDLRPIEEARALHELATEYGLTQREMQDRYGIPQATISRRLSLMKLPSETIEQIDHGELKLADAEQVVKELKDHPKRMQSALKHIAEPGTYWTAKRAIAQEKAEVKHAEKLKALKDKLAADNTRVVTNDELIQMDQANKATLGGHPGQLPLSVDEHSGEPCHVAIIFEHGTPTAQFHCVDVQRHSKSGDSKLKAEVVPHANYQEVLVDPEREEEANELEAAAEKRLAFIKDLLQKRVSTKDAIDLIAMAIGIDDGAAYFEVDPQYICDALSLDTSHSKPGDTFYGRLKSFGEESEENRIKATLALALVLIESSLGYRDSHDKWGDEYVDYLSFLEDHGYEMSDAEAAQLVTEEEIKALQERAAV